MMELSDKYYRKNYSSYTRKLYYLVPEPELIPWIKAFENFLLKSESSYSPKDIDRAVTAVIQCISKGVVTREDFILQLQEGVPINKPWFNELFYKGRVSPTDLRKLMLEL